MATSPLVLSCMLPTFTYFGGISPEPQLSSSCLSFFLPLTGLQIYAYSLVWSHTVSHLPTGGTGVTGMGWWLRLFSPWLLLTKGWVNMKYYMDKGGLLSILLPHFPRENAVVEPRQQ